MKIVRFNAESFKSDYGILRDREVARLFGDIFTSFEETGDVFPLNTVRLLPPVIPPNIIVIGLNYKSHAQELRSEFPKEPIILTKTTNALIGPEDEIVLPRIAPDEVDYEAELAIVIGKMAREVSERDALEYVFGYTCANDVSARDCQFKRDLQWNRAKSFDTFCPIGPCIQTEMHQDNAGIQLRLNGKIMQDSNTSDLIFPCGKLVSFLSHCMTLFPGTVILTGTPSGVGFKRTPPVFLRKGDLVEVEIEHIGVLRNKVV